MEDLNGFHGISGLSLVVHLVLIYGEWKMVYVLLNNVFPPVIMMAGIFDLILGSQFYGMDVNYKEMVWNRWLDCVTYKQPAEQK